MKWTLSATLLASIPALASGAATQTNAPARPTQPQSQRFLLVFETSRAMAKRAENSIKTVSNLISSGIYGQMQAGDTFGLWTFNDTLSAGKFPLAKWTPENGPKIASAAATFLRQQKLERGAVFHQVMPGLGKIVETSDRLTIIVVSSGDTDISGTKYDETINDSFKTWRAQQQKAKMPFVTVIRASRGEFVGNSVTPAPWQIEVPSWPQRLIAAPSPKTNTATLKSTALAATTNPAATVTNSGALIFTGKKSNPELTSTTATITNASDVPVTAGPTGSNTATNRSASTQAPVFISAAAITNAIASASPTVTPAPTGNPDPRPADSAQNGALQVHARTLQENSPVVVSGTNNSADANKPVQTAAALPPPSVLSRKLILAIGLGLTAMIGVFLFIRGGQQPRQESLITRSYQRPRK